MSDMDLGDIRPVVVNKPNDIAHGMYGFTDMQQRDGSYFVVDVDGIERKYNSDELLFIEFRKAPESRDEKIGRYLGYLVALVFGTALGKLL